MIGKILAVGAVSAALITVADKYNLLGINPNQKWWWERPPFAPQQTARMLPYIPPRVQQQLPLGVVGYSPSAVTSVGMGKYR